MNMFIRADESTPATGLFAVLVLFAMSGCGSVQEPVREIKLEATDRAVPAARRARARCPVRHIYLCERELGSISDTCYCVPELAMQAPGPGGPQRIF